MEQKSQQKPLLGAYLVVGEDALKRDVVVKRMRSRLERSGDLEFNHDVFDGEVSTGLDIVSACDTMPFMSDTRLVEVTNADKLKKADSEALVSYLKAPNETTVVMLVCEKLAKNTRLFKAVSALGEKAIIDCSPKAKQELPKMVRDMAVGHGVVFNDRAARKLIELVGDNTIALDAEIRKISLAHMGKDPVSEREVMSLVTRTSEPKPWDLTDALSARNLSGALSVLNAMSSASPYALMGMCTKRIRELICAKSLEERGRGSNLAKALKMPDWKASHYRNWAKGFTKAELHLALRAARDAERDMKSGVDPQDALLSWILKAVPRK